MLSRADDDFLDLSRMLAPKSVAVIGASDRPGNLGGDTVRRLLKFGFTGPVWPVNRSAATVAGLPCVASVSQLPEAPDLAVFALPAGALLEAIAECAQAGVRHGVAYAGGFAEAGGEGIALQNALVELCRSTGFLLCGPNCVGMINTSLPVTSTFSTALHELDHLDTGVISMVAQSGSIATNAFTQAQEAGFPFRHMISSGNEAVVGFADYLYALARDEGTRVIAGYIEGISDGPKLLRALEEARRQDKPVVLIKGGTTSASARAAEAHTAALAGEERVIDAILREMAVIRVYSVEELVDVALLLASVAGQHRPHGNGVGIVTFGGGNGVLAADQCAQNGLLTPALRPACIERLKPLLVSVATAANPLDLTPTTAFRAESLAQLPQALDVIAAEPDIHSLMLIVGSLASRGAEISEVIHEFCNRSAKPVCVSWPAPPHGIIEKLAHYGIHTFLEPARGVRALANLTRQRAAAVHPVRSPIEAMPFHWTRYVPEPRPTIVTEDRCHAILDAAELRAAAGVLVKDEASALRAADLVGRPVAAKGITPKITHRAAAGLIAVDLSTDEEIVQAFRHLTERAAARSVALDGIYVQAMHKGGTELLVSGFRDALFGPMISCGAGGGLTELIDDLVIERAPVNRALAAAMLERLRIRHHARDDGGALPTDTAAAFIADFSRLIASAPWPRFVFEVNPIKWRRDDAVAVDGLLIVEGTGFVTPAKAEFAELAPSFRPSARRESRNP